MACEILDFDLSDPATIVMNARGEVVTIRGKRRPKEPTTRFVAPSSAYRAPTAEEYAEVSDYYRRLLGLSTRRDAVH